MAKTRKPSENERNPTEIISSKIDGKSKGIEFTSMANWFCTPEPVKLAEDISENLKITTESRIVAKMSTIPVAETHERLKTRAKNR